jgi:hypothetical protein
MVIKQERKSSSLYFYQLEYKERSRVENLRFLLFVYSSLKSYGTRLVCQYWMRKAYQLSGLSE